MAARVPQRLQFVAAIALAAVGAVAQQPTGLDPPDPWPTRTAKGCGGIAAEHRSIVWTWLSLANDELRPLAAAADVQVLELRELPAERDYDAGFFAPLAELRELEVLRLPLQPTMGPVTLRGLGALPALRFLTLELQRPFRPDDVAALGAIGGLVGLTLVGGSTEAAAIRALSDLPHLQTLTLERVGGCRESALRELRALHGLRRLTLRGLGPQPAAERLGWFPADDSDGLTEGLAVALGDLPLLDSIALETCVVSAAAIQALPPGLRRVGLTACPDAEAAVVRAATRFENLEELRLGALPPNLPAISNDVAAAQAELIRGLPIRTLRYEFPMPAEVRAALASAIHLTDVSLEQGTSEDLTAVAQVPALANLTLLRCHLQGRGARGLAAAKTLRYVRFREGTTSPLFVGEVLAKQMPGVQFTVERL
ncbi:MAG: hypothetical protein KDE27_12430 [Planctomycetes bacterium]|nr:hypothetical protein [Planctomycetota bacterium]